jgi:hypothetical protein
VVVHIAVTLVGAEAAALDIVGLGIAGLSVAAAAPEAPVGE